MSRARTFIEDPILVATERWSARPLFSSHITSRYGEARFPSASHAPAAFEALILIFFIREVRVVGFIPRISAAPSRP